MERELWRVIRTALRRLPRRWPRNASYSNAEILAVLLWAALHKRERLVIERFFGALATPASGLYTLPPWIRRRHRVRTWVAAKLAIYSARNALAA